MKLRILTAIVVTCHFMSVSLASDTNNFNKQAAENIRNGNIKWVRKNITPENVNTYLDENNNTPLHIAVENNQFDIVEFLIYEGANVHTQNKTDQTPKSIASQKIQEVIKSSLRAIEQALKNNISLTYQPYINEQTINERVFDGMAPLHIAAQAGQKEVVEYLLHQKNINVDVRTSENNKTPLHLAAENGHIAVIDQLINKDADVHALSDNNRTPYELAQAHNQSDAAQMIASWFPSILLQQLAESLSSLSAQIKPQGI